MTRGQAVRIATQRFCVGVHRDDVVSFDRRGPRYVLLRGRLCREVLGSGRSPAHALAVATANQHRGSYVCLTTHERPCPILAALDEAAAALGDA